MNSLEQGILGGAMITSLLVLLLYLGSKMVSQCF